MNYTLSAAAKAAGVAKSTVSKALKDGSLSKVESVGNSYRIDPAELERWMSVRGKRSETLKIGRTETPVETPAMAIKNDAMQMKIDMLTENLEDMKKQRDSWQAQAEINTRLLEDHSKPRSLKERIFGKPEKAA